MSISFNSIPSALRVPFVTAEIDASQASQGPSILAYTALMLVQRTSAGSGVADTLYPITSVEDAITICGRGSIGHRMAIGWFASNKSTPLVIGVLDDDGGGVVATGTTTVTGTATEDGTIALYLGGVRVTVAVTSGDDETAVADAISAAIIANLDLPITSANVAGVVTHTFRHAGEVGNSYDVRDSHLDTDSVPAGITLVHVAVGSVVAGTTNPVLTTLIAALGDTWYQILAHPFTDATSLTAIEGELSDRFGPMRMIDGVAITSAADSHANLTTLGNTRNSQHSAIVAQAGANPLTPPMEFAAEAAALAAYYGAIDPARPLQTLVMSNAVQPAEADLFTIEERNNLLYDGIATTRAGGGGAVQLERMITTYQTNVAGAADTAYLDVATMLTLIYLRYSWRTRIATRYPRHKLASDGARFGAGQKVMTPKLGKAEALGWFRQMEELGLVENYDQFKEDLVVERNADPNRLDWLLSPDLINQLIVSAGQIAFRL